MKALLLIDLQNDFLPGGALAVPGGDEIITLINSLQPQFDLVVATQDWHPANHKSFASSHHGKQPFDKIDWMDNEQVLWPDHCVQGTNGASLASSLNKKRVAAIFRKGMSPEVDSYSGFFDNRRLHSTGLSDYLRGMGIKSVYITGLAGDYCVYFTAMDALKEGFETCVIEDATRSINNNAFNEARTVIENKGGKVMHSRQLSFH